MDEIAANLPELVRDLVRTVPLLTDQINGILARINDLNVTDATLKTTIEAELKALRLTIHNFERLLVYGEAGAEPLSSRIARIDERTSVNAKEIAELKTAIDRLSGEIDQEFRKLTKTPEGVKVEGAINFKDGKTQIILGTLAAITTIVTTAITSLFTTVKVDSVKRDVKEDVKEEVIQEQGEVVPYLFPSPSVSDSSKQE